MEPTDIQLMLRVREGDLEAFRVLSQRYRRPLRRFLWAMLRDEQQAEDATQETLLRLWLLRLRYEPTGKFSTYLFQIARHYALNVRKKRSVEGQYSVGETFDGRFRGSPEGELLRNEARLDVEGAIHSLPSLYRTVFLMSHRDGLKYVEIGALLRIPEGTVKSRMAEAVKRLRRSLLDEEREG